MGNCDHSTGQCVCREGWTGAACERLECSEDCSGNGECLPMYRLAQLRQSNGEPDPTVYGSTDLVRPFGTSVYASPSTWDFDMIYGCLCDSGGRGGSADTDGFHGGVYRPRVGARGAVSGLYTENSRLSGWGGYMCSQREYGQSLEGGRGRGGVEGGGSMSLSVTTSFFIDDAARVVCPLAVELVVHSGSPQNQLKLQWHHISTPSTAVAASYGCEA